MKSRPRLGIVYEPESVPLLTLRRDLSELCDLTWILDPAVVQIADSLPLLRRLGDVTELSLRDPEKSVEKLRSTSLDGLMTFSDGALLDTAILAASLRLPANSAEAATRLVDKWQQRSALRAAGIPTPDFARIESTMSDPSGQEHAAAVRFPAVLKPSTGNGGRHVHRLDRIEDLADIVRSIRQNGFEGDLLLETELIGQSHLPYGDYVSVECAAEGGVMRTVAVTGRMPLAPPFRETGAFVPAELEPDLERLVSDMALAAASAIGVTVGCLHIEIKLTQDGPRIIEVNGRVAGGGIPDLVADATGVSMYELAARSALGFELPPLNTKRVGVVSYQFALQTPLGIETELTEHAVPTLESIDSVRRVGVRARSVSPRSEAGSYDYLLMLYGVARSHNEIVTAYRAMNSVTQPTKPR